MTTYRFHFIETIDYVREYTEKELVTFAERAGLTASELLEQYEGDLVEAVSDPMGEARDLLERDIEDDGATREFLLESVTPA